MEKLNILTASVGLLVLVVIFEMLRRRQLREKYAALWILVGLFGVIPLAIFPQALNRVALAVGVASGASLVLFLGVVILLLICTHLSWEVSQLEEETRTLAEEVALIRTRLAERDAVAASGRSAAEPAVKRPDSGGIGRNGDDR
jgi:hypothetical protein